MYLGPLSESKWKMNPETVETCPENGCSEPMRFLARESTTMGCLIQGFDCNRQVDIFVCAAGHTFKRTWGWERAATHIAQHHSAGVQPSEPWPRK